ncbi:hypothetical protein HOI26_01230 [Candidatus Woesearchaeota archaeon]|jgi:hypothetical protein|nr:hypothetical protein [Candidatus Woesearchaeota archaeon]MBT5739697.1 hypothetical protein [Candidatus Woesearchaeota archaeon]
MNKKGQVWRYIVIIVLAVLALLAFLFFTGYIGGETSQAADAFFRLT